MSKLTKRLLYIAIVALVIAGLSTLSLAQDTQQVQDMECYKQGDTNGDGSITNNDAFYILYHELVDEDAYPIRQTWDYNADGVADMKDAFYILYHNLVSEEDYALKDIVHSYYDPVWVWTEDNGTVTAQVTFKCACGEESLYTEANGVTVTAGELVPATCVKAGSQTYSAAVTPDETQYTSQYTQTLPAGDGHVMTGTQDCTHSSTCANGCGYTLVALGHKWVSDGVTSATCTEDAYESYHCEACAETKTETQQGTAGHVLKYWKDVQDGCTFTKWYQCDNCPHEQAGTAASDIYKNHTYTAELTKGATCVSAGVKTYTCSCGASYPEEIPANATAHNWQEGTKENVVTNWFCGNEGCNETKTTVSASTTPLTNQTLTNELQMDNGVSMALDQKTVEGLGLEEEQAIQISVTPVEEGNALLAGLSEEKKAQIGDNTVYDFNMSSGNQAITNFDGYITISIPYELQPGDDIDSIDVWYISDTGEITRVTGTYSNKMVTFTTNHFSYYTVIRLTPAERCARYGHIMVESYKAATCTVDGYDMKVCQRCGHEEKNKVLTRTGHSYKTTTVAETCDTEGSFRKVCGNCQDTVTGTIPALGHSMETTQTVDASCTAAGKTVAVCTRKGCSYTQETEQPQLAHKYVTQKVVKEDCSNKGYELQECSLCGDEINVNETAPLGHVFVADDATWSWSADHLGATITLVCTHDKAHTKQLNAVVTTKNQEGSCTQAGGVVYTATAAWNKDTYTDSYTEAVTEPGHTAGSEWLYNDSQHYHECTVCGESVGQTNHEWDAGNVTKEATCKEKGSIVYTCIVCGYEDEQDIPKSKEHTYENGVCTVCGQEESACQHLKATASEVDVSAYNLCEGTTFTRYSCDCGQNVYYEYDLFCDMDYDVEPELVTIDGRQWEKYTYECPDCALVSTALQYAKKDPNACQLHYVVDLTFTKGDVQIANTEISMGTWEHGGNVLLETVDLTQYGLCKEVLEVYACGCEMNVISTQLKTNCNWEWTAETEDSYIYKCNSCNAKKVRIRSFEDKDENCAYWDRDTIVYYVADVEIYRVEEQSVYYEHDYAAGSYEVFGNSCFDGAYYELVCQDCGAEDEYFVNDYHEQYVQEFTDLSTKNICATGLKTSKCACGQVWQSELVYPEDQACELEFENNTAQCALCGVTVTRTYKEGKDDQCVYYDENRRTYTDETGNVLAVVGYSYVESDYHDYWFESATLDGETCEDGKGVDVILRCNDCQKTQRTQTYGHTTFKAGMYNYADYGMCGGDLTLYRCACEATAYAENFSSCNWTEESYQEDETGYTEVYSCEQCGTYRKYQMLTVDTEDPCVTETTVTYTFYKESEEEPLLVVSYDRRSIEHDLLATFQLNDAQKGCAGGYTVTDTCQRCDYTKTNTIGSGSEGHPQYVVSKETIVIEGLCSSIELTTNSCPCGTEISAEANYIGENTCQWTGVNPYEEKCDVCNVERTLTRTTQNIPGDPCYKRVTGQMTYSKDGQTLGSYNEIWMEETHRRVYTFSSDTCDTQYTAYATCLDCGLTEEYTDYGCGAYPVERETKVNDANACGVVDLVHYKCPCGKNESWEIAEKCNTVHNGYTDDGISIYRCVDCGMESICEEDEVRQLQSCEAEVQLNATYTIGETVYTFEKTYTTTSHRAVYRFEKNGESCTDGVTVYENCMFCDYEKYWSTEEDHNTYRTEYYNLADYGACGGEVYHYGCACGENGSWSYYLNNCSLIPTDEKIEGTELLIHRCETCGLQFGWGEEGELDTENCLMVGTFYFVLRNGEEELINVQGTTTTVQHDDVIVEAELMEEGTDCENGITCTWQCRNCNITWTNELYGHSTFVKEELDLTDYGSVCGGTLLHYSCACGKNQSVEISEKTQCELDSVQIDNWVEGAISGEQDNVTGWVAINSAACKYNCAVTGPTPCGVKIRMSDSWVKEGCYAVRYQTWQLGDCDAETGEYQKEISFATGDKELFHDYERIELEEETVSGYKDVCKDCQSQYLSTNIYDENGELTKTESIHTNTLDNDYEKYRSSVFNHAKVGNGSWPVSYRYDITYADGSTWWYEETYTFDIENCMRTVYYVDADGEEDTSEGECHVNTDGINSQQDATCTQWGYYNYWYGCKTCGMTENEIAEVYEPTGHDWQYDDDLGMYVCGRCYLKNSQGADGAIIMEDMTGSHGQGTEYVVGYYNPQDIQFVVYVTAVLEDVEGDDNQLDLNVSQITYKTSEVEGYTAVGIDVSEAHDLAAEQMAAMDYTGSYAIRVSFVPVGSGNTLDYAVTFDSVMAG